MRTRILLTIACLLLGSAGTSSAFIDAATAKKEQAKIAKEEQQREEAIRRKTDWMLNKIRGNPDYSFSGGMFSDTDDVANFLSKTCLDRTVITGRDLRDYLSDRKPPSFALEWNKNMLERNFTSSSFNCFDGGGTIQDGTTTYTLANFVPVSFSILLGNGVTVTTFFSMHDESHTVTINDNNGNTISYSTSEHAPPVVLTAKLLVGFETGIGASTAESTGRISHTKLPALISRYYDEMKDKPKNGLFTISMWLMKNPAFQSDFLKWAEDKFDKV